ncbi:hypothetical protein FRX31_015899 [Thalictrum thalictroides]|uniref:Uncharacterized protein n=1 Tax=Thalictrum thalictroides TaxID=46969 RepID=A0A7J6WEC6_THATH|nr:hypothetical protein FRX31_015899 [Thalictrum thalictroides]
MVSQNLGRTYLKCQNGFCADSKQWLDEAIVKGDSDPKGCFKCYDDHLEENCPWSGKKCSHVYCDGTTDVYPVYKKYKTNGWRYLQCLTCKNSFQWLMVAKRQRQKQLEMLNESTIKQEKIVL